MPDIGMPQSVTGTTALGEIRKLVDTQAEDEGLWFVAESASEAYMQQELRRLHALVETFTGGGEPDTNMGMRPSDEGES